MALQGDMDCNCRIDAADLQALTARWRQAAGRPYDLDGDGVVSVADIMRVAARWVNSCSPTMPPMPTSTPTPTPTTTPTPTATPTHTATPTPTPTSTFTPTPTFTPTSTPTPTNTPVAPPDRTWRLLGFEGVGVPWIAFSPDYANDQTVYVITLDGEARYLYRSTDGLHTWSQVSALGSQLRHVAFSPNYINDQTIFVVTAQGLFYSSDRGATWVQKVVWSSIGLSAEISAFVISPDFVNNHTMFLGTLDGYVWHSVDGGSTWSASGPLYGNEHWVRSLAISPNYRNDHMIFAGVGKAWDWYHGGVFRSTDGGATWASVNSGLTYQEVGSLAISPNYASDRTLYVTVWAGGLFRSTDGGETWVDVNDGQPNRRLSYVVFSPNYDSDHSMALGTWGEYADGGVYLSIDSGNTWLHRSNGLSTRWIHMLAYSPNYSNDNILLAGGEQTNGGGLWIYSPPAGSLIWPMFGHDPQHTGRSPYVGPQSPTLKWRFLAPNHGAAALMYAPVVGPSGTIYVGTNDGYLYALNSTDGTSVWSYNKGNVAAPAIGPREEVFKTIGGGQYETAAVVRLDSSGNQQWQFSLPGYGNFSSLTYKDDTLYLGWPYDRSVYAIDAASGVARWSYRVGDASRQFSAPAVAPDGTVYIGATDSYLYAFNGTNGSLLWSYQTGGQIWIWASPVVGPDNTVYVGSTDGYLYAINGTDGTLRWRYATGGRIMASAALGQDGTLYVGSEDGYVYAINTSNGTLRWRFQTGDMVSSTPAVDALGNIYIGSHDGYIYALSGADGTLRWRYLVGFYGGNTAPAIGSDGVLYVTGSSDSGEYFLYAISDIGSSP